MASRFHPEVYKESGRIAARAKLSGLNRLHLTHLCNLETRIAGEKEKNRKEARDLFDQGYQEVMDGQG